MPELLNLQNYFPPIEDNAWKRLIPEDLTWQPLEGIQVQPYYRQCTSKPGHVFDRRDWLIRADTDLAHFKIAQDAGAESLGFSLHEPAQLPEQLPVGEIPLFFSGEGITHELIQTLRIQATRRGYALDKLRGAVSLPEKYSARSALQAAEGTRLWTQVINLEQWHDAGATHVQELACGFAQLSDLMADLVPNCTAEHLYFQVPIGERYLLDLARLRALRMGTAEVLRVYNTPKHKIHIVGIPSRRYESVLDPDTHLVRQTLQYAAAITGGCDVIASPDTERSLRILQIMRHEGKLGIVADAAAGSWMIEHLTEKLGQSAWELFQEIESKGGFSKARPWIEKKIQQANAKRRAEILSGEDIVVGGNTYFSGQIEESTPQKKSILAPLETIRLRAKRLEASVNVQIHGICDPWLKRLLDLCGCSSQNESGSTDLIVTEADQGFLIQNQQHEQVLVNIGEPLPAAADRLFTLLEINAT